MENIIIEVMNNYGYIGICLLILLENIFPPIPSELILTFSGFMTINSDITIIGVIISSTIGSLIGASVLYLIGYILNKDKLITITSSKYGKLLKIKKEHIEKADIWFKDKGSKTVLLCRFIPVIRSLISIPAGMSKMNYVKFIIYTIIGSIIWNTILTLIGAYAGDKQDIILSFIDSISNIILIIILIIIFYLIHKQCKKK